ncbi:MAG: membrane protein insertase YidC [Bacteroidales bacterium]|nr:membrane protein insertase YidC [Bacteroidales bacterium]
MDKNTITGFVLMFLIIVGFSWFNKPSQEQLDAAKEQKRKNDSIALASTLHQEANLKADSIASFNAAAIADSVKGANSDSASTKIQFGTFSSLASGENTYSKVENDLVELTMSSKGGRIASARLKKFVTSDSLPLILFDEAESSFGFSFFTSDSRLVNTKDLYFKQIPSKNPLQFIYRLTVDDKTWMDFVYTLKKDDYKLEFEIKGKNLASVMQPSTNALDFNWAVKMRQQEKGRSFEERYSGLNYKFIADDVEELSQSKDDSKSIPNKLKWVSFKDQFFACIAISDKGFTSNELTSKVEAPTSPYIKSYDLASAVDFDIRGSQTAKMDFYFGPIKHSLLKRYDKGIPAENQLNLDKIVPLGGKIIRWANTGIVLPMFNFFGGFMTNYGLIILVMTFCIKMLIFPLTYKSYISSAKMRVLQPQIQEINLKLPGSDRAAERSAATMNLYKQVGVSPMGGCLPMLLQMPFLFAMYSFFPSSIELRQESFLWAHDLSTYDAIISWSGNIPLVTKYFGNHISLFCILMTVTNIIYTHINMKTQPTSTQMPGMKAMMYMMPVMFLFMFNQYASGLSFYFFVSTLITIIQTYAIRATVNEEKLLAQLNENKKKPMKKSGFAARLEQAQKKQQQMLKEQQKNKRK